MAGCCVPGALVRVLLDIIDLTFVRNAAPPQLPLLLSADESNRSELLQTPRARVEYATNSSQNTSYVILLLQLS